MIALAGAALAAIVGWLAAGRWIRGGWPAGAALGFAAGAGVLSLQLLAYSLLHLPWKPWLVLLPWAPLAWQRLRQRPAFQRPAPPNWLEVLALLAMLAAPALWLPYERAMPLTTRGWDAWAIWLFKAKAFYLDGNVQGVLARAGEFAWQPSYPLLVPLYGAFLHTLAGTASDAAAKSLSPCFFFALLGVFYCLARRFTTRPAALVFTAMLANLHMVNIVAFELAGYADTALSVYLLAGAGFLYAWLRDGQPSDLALASVFSSLAAWTKNEGLFFLAGVGTVAAARLAVRRIPDWRCWMAVLLPPAVTVLPWLVLRRWYHVPASDLFAAGRLNWANLVPGIGSFAQAFQLGRYNLTFWLLLGALLAARRAGLGAPWWILPGLAGWQMLGLLGAYAAGRNDLGWWIGTSLDRILAQLAPLALFASALIFGALAAPAQTEHLTPRRESRNLKAKRSKTK